jgi:hypothetical protein
MRLLRFIITESCLKITKLFQNDLISISNATSKSFLLRIILSTHFIYFFIFNSHYKTFYYPFFSVKNGVLTFDCSYIHFILFEVFYLFLSHTSIHTPPHHLFFFLVGKTKSYVCLNFRVFLKNLQL